MEAAGKGNKGKQKKYKKIKNHNAGYFSFIQLSEAPSH